MVPVTTRVQNWAVFWGFVFYFFFLIECARCLYDFVQMTAEPGKAVDAIDA